jgi:ribosomal protein S18 acetylase RimI-like enzyme
VLVVRRATAADAAEITRLRRVMFASMGVDCDAVAWEPACIAFFEAHLGGQDVVAMVVDAPDGHGLAASGVIELSRLIPSPNAPAGTSGYISTISTDARWRRRGMAAAVMEALLAVARDRGVDNVDLHATDEGRPLYERLGFEARGGSPALRLRLHPPREQAVTPH